MKNIRIILIFLGLCLSFLANGSSPEFYGIYANSNNHLIEMDDNKNPHAFDQKVQFLVFQKHAEMYANGLTIERAIFVRNVNDPGMDGRQPPKNVNKWQPRRNGGVETRKKPVSGQPEQIYVVPRSLLPAGFYFVKSGDKVIGVFFVDVEQVLNNLDQGSDCIDIKVGGGWDSYYRDLGGTAGEEIPCSKSPLKGEKQLSMNKAQQSELLNYIGTWTDQDNSLLIEISYTSNSIRIREFHGAVEMGGTEYFGKYSGDRIIAVGDPKDFYKFDLPEFKLLENGELQHVCGACFDDRLKKTSKKMPKVKYSPPANDD